MSRMTEGGVRQHQVRGYVRRDLILKTILTGRLQTHTPLDLLESSTSNTAHGVMRCGAAFAPKMRAERGGR